MAYAYNLAHKQGESSTQD